MNLAVLEFVEAARLRGEGLWWIISREILPNAMAPLIVRVRAALLLQLPVRGGALSSSGSASSRLMPTGAAWSRTTRRRSTFGLAPLYPAMAIALLHRWYQPRGRLAPVDRCAALRSAGRDDAPAAHLLSKTDEHDPFSLRDVAVTGAVLVDDVDCHAEARRDPGTDRRIRRRQIHDRAGRPGLYPRRAAHHRRPDHLRRDGASRLDRGAAPQHPRQVDRLYRAERRRLVQSGHDADGHRSARRRCIHGAMTWPEARASCAAPVQDARTCPIPDTFGERYPHQVSGGQLQRAMAAMAMACQPGASCPRRADDRARRDDADRGAGRRCASSSAPSARPASTSPTISPWWRRSPTGSWCCATARWSRSGRRRSDPARPRYWTIPAPSGGGRVTSPIQPPIDPTWTAPPPVLALKARRRASYRHDRRMS